MTSHRKATWLPLMLLLKIIVLSAVLNGCASIGGNTSLAVGPQTSSSYDLSSAVKSDSKAIKLDAVVPIFGRIFPPIRTLGKNKAFIRNYAVPKRIGLP